MLKRLENFWNKQKSKVAALAMLSPLAALIIYSESHRLGSYRPESLSAEYTSYVAYEFPHSTRLYLPAIKGMVNGPIIDRRNDEEIDFVGCVTYARMPYPFDILRIGSTEKKRETKRHYQALYDGVMKEIRDSTK